MLKRSLMWLGVAFATAATASSVGATITSTGGQIQLIAPPPSVLFDALESDATMFAFDEQQCVRLDNAIPVDITQPGTYDDDADLTNSGTIPAGTWVRSHFVHADKVGTQPPPIIYEGTLTVDEEILGIAILAHALNETDTLGAPGTLYPTGIFGRALNLDDHDDFVVEQADRHNVTVHTQVRMHADQIRVITECTGTIVVRKQTDPAGDPTMFSFTGDVAGTIGDGGSIIVSGLAPGTYHSTEMVPTGWELTSIVCDDGDSTGNTGTATATFQLDGGETITCTFADRLRERLGRQGCTPGYWKQSHHFDSWVGYAPSDFWETVFGVDAFTGNPTLLNALSQGGGGLNALGRMSTAALLNATSPGVDYPLTSSEIIAQTKAAVLSGSKTQIEALKNQLDANNNLGCPLN